MQKSTPSCLKTTFFAPALPGLGFRSHWTKPCPEGRGQRRLSQGLGARGSSGVNALNSILRRDQTRQSITSVEAASDPSAS